MYRMISDMYVAIYAPVGRDASVLCTLLEATDLRPLVCTSAAAFTAALDENAMLAIATEEALSRCSADQITHQLKRQPLWSSIPIIALADAGVVLPGGVTSVLERLGGITLITRPLRQEVLTLAVCSARRTRLLQLQVRDQLEQLSQHATELEARVDERTAALALEVRERRQIETSLMEARRLESLGRLTGGVAHDFNNLLQVIVGATQLLQLLSREAPQLQKPIASINRATEQGARLTQQLLSFARRQPMQITDVRLDEHVQSLAQLLHHSLGRNVKLEIEIGDTPKRVRTDLAQLEIALLNLVINARDAMPDGGTATLTVKNLTLPDPTLPELATLSGDYVQIALHDEGHGMTEDVARQAFEPFFTTKPLGKGTGLGLSQVYGFAKQSRGTTLLRTGQTGTTVAIVLPASAAQSSEAPNKPEKPSSQLLQQNLVGLKVLCVEDDPFIAAAAVEMLSTLGCSVCCAHSADEALQSDFNSIDLVFSDVRMPGSMDGLEMVKKLLHQYPSLPIVLTSGFIGEPERLDGMPLEFVRKPYTPATVVAAMSAALSCSTRISGAGQ